MSVAAKTLMLFAVSFSLLASCQTPAAAEQNRPLRILHVMSFDSPWRWTDGQFAGFKQGLGPVDVEYKVFQMDVKRHSRPEEKAQRGQMAREIIDSWRPDLVYTSDDDAVEFVTRKYLNTSLPFVFSGVNKTLESHGLTGASNVTGVLEKEHFVESVRLLKEIVPQVKRLAIITDHGTYWGSVIERIESSLDRLPGISLATIDRVQSFEEFQEKLASYPHRADAIVFLGIFTLKDRNGNNVPYQEVQKWASQNSRLPDISFWVDRVHFGVLASVTVSEHEQGLAAGRLAREILINGRRPSTLPIEATVKGQPVISLARAGQLGISVKSSLLLTSEVVTEFQWGAPGQ